MLERLDGCLWTPDLVNEIAGGWTKMRPSKYQSSINENNKNNGLYLVNFNLLYNRTDNRLSPTLVYSYYDYNIIFSEFFD